MSKVTGADVRAVLALVGEAHDTEDLDEFRAFLLPALRRLVPCDCASYNEIRGDGEVVATLAWREPPDRVALPSPTGFVRGIALARGGEDFGRDRAQAVATAFAAVRTRA